MSIKLTLEYWDSQGNRHIDFNDPNEQKLYQEWLNKNYKPMQLKLELDFD